MTNQASYFLHSTELPGGLQQLNSMMCGRTTHSNAYAMLKMLTLLWLWAWHNPHPSPCCRLPTPARWAVCGWAGWLWRRRSCQASLHPCNILPAFFSSSSCCKPAWFFISPYLFIHFKHLLVRKCCLLPRTLLAAFLMSSVSRLPVKIWLMTLVLLSNSW